MQLVMSNVEIELKEYLGFGDLVERGDEGPCGMYVNWE
jgi:hypothetical protein